MASRRHSITFASLAILVVSAFDSVAAFAPISNRPLSYSYALSMAGGWGNNQERPVLNEEIGGVNGAPIYDAYEIEDRGQFMKRVNDERKTLRRKKASDLLEVARIAGVELKKKERDPNQLDMFDPEDMAGPDEYLDVSI